MKCLESERLIGYAHRLIEKSAAMEVRHHLEECEHCRAIVEQHARLDVVLSEWKTIEPTPAFDVRVRQAVEADQARRQRWGWQWFRNLALASLGFVIVAGTAWLSPLHRGQHRAGAGTMQAVVWQQRTAEPAQVPALTSTREVAAQAVQAHGTSARRIPNSGLESVRTNDDRDAQAIDDYDLAANFELLSEIPKSEPRVAN